MIKDIVCDYFRVFRYGMHGQRRRFFYMAIYMPVYIILLAVLQASLGNITWSFAVMEFVVLLPLSFSYGSVLTHPLCFNKMLYLCPLSPEERRNYLYGSYFFRIGLHMSAAAVGTGILALYFHCGAFPAVELLLNHLLAAVLVSQERDTLNSVNGMRSGEILFVSAMLSNALQIIIIVSGTKNLWPRAVILLAFCFVQLPLAVRYMKLVRRELQAAVFFEGV